MSFFINIKQIEKLKRVFNIRVSWLGNLITCSYRCFILTPHLRCGVYCRTVFKRGNTVIKKICWHIKPTKNGYIKVY